MAPHVPKHREHIKRKSRIPFLKRHHGMLAAVILLGWVVPPLAVVIRFGIGIDFFINVILTCCGYFPGHAHNFFLQNIRNNKGKGRTPKWALKAGLVEDDAPYIKSTRQWGNRYEQQNANNAYDIDDIPEEDEYGNPIERAIIKHGRGPAQPSAGFGDRGNETMGLEADRRQDDLLSGLPDEDRDRRKREKKNRVQEYGAGYDDDYEREQERRNGGGGGGGRSNGLIDDLQDPDYAPRPIRNGGSSNFGSNNPYGGGGGGGSSRGTSAPSRSRSNGGDGLVGDLEDPDALYGSRRNGEQSIMQKRSMGGSGKQKKSDRYGLSSDHQDLGAAPSKSSSSSGKAGKKQKSMDSYSQGGDRGSYGNDRYDGYDVREESRGGSSRRQASKSGGGDDDFLNHQF